MRAHLFIYVLIIEIFVDRRFGGPFAAMERVLPASRRELAFQNGTRDRSMTTDPCHRSVDRRFRSIAVAQRPPWFGRVEDEGTKRNEKPAGCSAAGHCCLLNVRAG